MSLYARLLLRSMRFVLPESVRDGLVGDLEELHQERRVGFGRVAAGLWLTSQARVVVACYGPRLARSFVDRNGRWSVSGLVGLVRASARQLMRAPGYTSVVVLMMALGVGVNVTAFSLLDGVVLTPMPYSGVGADRFRFGGQPRDPNLGGLDVDPELPRLARKRGLLRVDGNLPRSKRFGRHRWRPRIRVQRLRLV